MRASPVLRACMTANCWAWSSVEPPSSLVKSNGFVEFLKLTPVALESQLGLFWTRRGR